MSRIPPPQSGLPKRNDENKQPATFKKPLFAIQKSSIKRPGDAHDAPSEKKQKTASSAQLKRTDSSAQLKLKRADSGTALQPFSAKNAGFSEGAKRAALQPIPESNLIRGSMPAVSVSVKSGMGKSKRPNWDLKGRMQDMEENFLQIKSKNATLEEQLTMTNASYNDRIAALEEANTLLHKDVEIKTTLSEEASGQIERLQKKLKDKTEEFEEMLSEKDTKIRKLTHENEMNESDMHRLKIEHDNLKNSYLQESATLKSTISSVSCLRAELEASKLLIESLNGEKKQLIQSNANKDDQNRSLSQRIAELESRLRDEESARRKLHNTVQELKGNIRVYCRIRPALPDELKDGMKLAGISILDEKTLEIHQMTEFGLSESGKTLKRLEFSFDCIFEPTATQNQVFSEISQLVQSSIDGYNVCIFAYGQTGSGKTFTMEGPADITSFESSDSSVGMIPRSVHQIFQCISDLKPRGWKYQMDALFLEIYNERIQDLLNSESLNGNVKVEIVKSAGKGGDCLLSNVTPTPVTCGDEINSLLKKARINRAVAATKCNEHSSRSHYVFQLKIHGENSITGEKCDGILNLVDLAGSERIKDSGSEGERLTEAKSINKSLSNLGKVIMALSKKENHIPYRDSKLTHLLANSLGGNSKTLMFVNVSPDNENVSETINSLRFATKVNQCNIGTAQKRVK